MLWFWLRFGLRRPRLFNLELLVCDASTGNGKVPDHGSFRPLYGQFFPVQQQPDRTHVAITEEEHLIGTPDKALSFFENCLLLGAGIGPDQEPGIFKSYDLKIQFIRSSCLKLFEALQCSGRGRNCDTRAPHMLVGWHGRKQENDERYEYRSTPDEWFNKGLPNLLRWPLFRNDSRFFSIGWRSRKSHCLGFKLRIPFYDLGFLKV